MHFAAPSNLQRLESCRTGVWDSTYRSMQIGLSALLRSQQGTERAMTTAVGRRKSVSWVMITIITMSRVRARLARSFHPTIPSRFTISPGWRMAACRFGRRRFVSVALRRCARDERRQPRRKTIMTPRRVRKKPRLWSHVRMCSARERNSL